MTSEIAEKPSYPSWLNSDFFYSFLQNNKHLPEATDSLSIESIHIEPATAAGDNYMSIIYRVLIEFSVDRGERKTLPLIVKLLPDSAAIGDITEKFNAFPKEIKLYAEIIPALEEIWKNAGHTVEFGPKHYFSSESPRPVIVMDDLKARGYKMLSRQKGLNLAEAKVLLTKLAMFHSASVIHYDENGPYSALLNEGIARMEVKEGMDEYYNTMYASLMEMLEEWDFAAPYLPKLRLWKNKIFDTAYMLTQAENNSFNVLNHGDVWTNNFMFRKLEGNLEALLVDYQLSSWGSPAIDFLYFIINAFSTDELVEHYDNMLLFYYTELSNDFKKLGKPEKVPSLEEIQEAIQRKGFFGAMMIIESVPIMKSDPDLKIDLNEVLENSEEGKAIKRKIYWSEIVKESLEILLPFLEKKGFLDIPM